MDNPWSQVGQENKNCCNAKLRKSTCSVCFPGECFPIIQSSSSEHYINLKNGFPITQCRIDYDRQNHVGPG